MGQDHITFMAMNEDTDIVLCYFNNSSSLCCIHVHKWSARSIWPVYLAYQFIDDDHMCGTFPHNSCVYNAIAHSQA